MNPHPPAILLAYSRSASHQAIDAFLLGCEEERVPARAVPRDGSAVDIAAWAAAESPLFTGAGIDGRTLCVHEQHLAQTRPVVMVDPSSARLAGVAAGRIVRGRPLPADAARIAPGSGMLPDIATLG